eukprot:jgi/Ulvmu1/5583/UM023_0120.1
MYQAYVPLCPRLMFTCYPVNMIRPGIFFGICILILNGDQWCHWNLSPAPTWVQVLAAVLKRPRMVSATIQQATRQFWPCSRLRILQNHAQGVTQAAFELADSYMAMICRGLDRLSFVPLVL